MKKGAVAAAAFVPHALRSACLVLHPSYSPHCTPCQVLLELVPFGPPLLLSSHAARQVR